MIIKRTDWLKTDCTTRHLFEALTLLCYHLHILFIDIQHLSRIKESIFLFGKKKWWSAKIASRRYFVRLLIKRINLKPYLVVLWIIWVFNILFFTRNSFLYLLLFVLIHWSLLKRWSTSIIKSIKVWSCLWSTHKSWDTSFKKLVEGYIKVSSDIPELELI